MFLLGREPPAFVRNYIGLPFDERGRTREGCDCGGLAVLFYRERFGIEIEGHDDDYTVAGPMKAYVKHRILQENARGWLEVEEGEEQFADLLLMRTGRALRHVGIIVARGWWLHTEEGCNSACERYGALRLRNFAIYRHPLLAAEVHEPHAQLAK